MGAALQRRVVSPIADDELLLETCDVSVGRAGLSETRSYTTLVPWDVPLRLAATSLCVVVIAWTMVAVPELYEFHRIPPTMLAVAVSGGLLLGAAMVVSQIPRRVIRKDDELEIEFVLHSHHVPLGDVLELVMLKDGSQFWQLLRRWKVWPRGRQLRCFFGAPSSAGTLCVLLTRRCFWSFVFCLQDPVQFLLDNQKPLVLEASYRTNYKVAVREDESMASEKIATISKGRYVKVLEQRGRRVLIELEGSEVKGWMSYLSSKGVALLSKHRGNAGEAEPGMIGASEFTRSDDGPLELGLLGVGRLDGVE